MFQCNCNVGGPFGHILSTQTGCMRLVAQTGCTWPSLSSPITNPTKLPIRPKLQQSDRQGHTQQRFEPTTMEGADLGFSPPNVMWRSGDEVMP